jgi:isoleucyl-tRNA synthetase
MYLEATDQHRGWFQSSLMTSIALNNRAPYKICVTHGFVVDLDGKKISKSGTYEKPTAADHFVGQNGADLLRLWASSIDYTSDVPFSEEMFMRLGDTYRRIRNTLRILLGNLYDFPVAGVGDPGRPVSPMPATTLIDRWILQRLDEVIRDCRSAYEAFEFHKVYHALNQFCAVDLSSLYVDITKDRMYCDAADSPRRCATQVVMHEIFNALCRLLAPILAFTAEEAWRHSVPTSRDSVHLEEFPEPEDRDGRTRPQPARRGEGPPSAQVAELLRLRGVIAQAIERARQEKLIGNTLEARVVLHSDSDVTEKVDREELEEFFIVSDLTIHRAKEASASVTKTPYAKCARCWRYRPTVRMSTAHPDLCDRCESVATALEKAVR